MAVLKLHDVAALALKDVAFFEALKADPDAALETYHLALSPADTQTLKSMLEPGLRATMVDVPKLIAWARHEMSKPAVTGGAGVTPDAWEVDWGSEWKLGR